MYDSVRGELAKRDRLYDTANVKIDISVYWSVVEHEYDLSPLAGVRVTAPLKELPSRLVEKEHGGIFKWRDSKQEPPREAFVAFGRFQEGRRGLQELGTFNDKTREELKGIIARQMRVDRTPFDRWTTHYLLWSMGQPAMRARSTSYKRLGIKEINVLSGSCEY